MDRVRYTIRPRHDHGNGAFSVFSYDLQEALDIAKGMTERGVEDVEILDENGVAFDMIELERLAREKPDDRAS